MCMQDGNAELILRGDTFRLTAGRDADSLESTAADGRTVVARRADQ
jgi:hypothetical protein